MKVAVAEVIRVRDVVMVVMRRSRETRDGEAPSDGVVKRVIGEMLLVMLGMIPVRGKILVAIDRVMRGEGEMTRLCGVWFGA